MLQLWASFAVMCAPLAASAQSPLAQRLRAQSYERWTAAAVPTQAAAAQERATIRAVVHFARAHRLRLVRDTRLDSAAGRLLPWAQANAGQPLPIDSLQTHAWQAGDTDAGLSALALHADPNEPLGLAVQKALAQTLPSLTANRFGLAQAGDIVVLTFATHWMHLAPTPAQVDVGQDVRVAGQDLDARIETLTLAIARPDGTLTHTRPPLLNAAFAEHVAVGDVPGVLDVQILIDRGHGPEVAAQYPIGVGQSPWLQTSEAAPRTAGVLHPAVLTKAQRVQAKQALVSLVWGLRRAHSLGLPEASTPLMLVAQRHSDDMGAHHFFAHTSPSTGDVTQRLAAVQQPYIRVVENIAAAQSLDGGFAQWVHSPSHRANLLDPSVTHIGVGIAEGDAPDDVLMVLVMAHLP